MQFTIETAQKRSKTAHEQATFHFGRTTGLVWLLTRDSVKSVSDHYRVVAKCDANDPKVVLFSEDTFQTRLLAVFLHQKGFKPVGVTYVGDTQLNSYNPKRDGYDFRLTNAETIRGALGLPCQKRRKSLDLGLVAKGSEMARKLSVSDMRAAILARN